MADFAPHRKTAEPVAASPAVDADECACCGGRTVRPLARRGRFMRYRNLAVPVPEDVLIPTCFRCRAEFVDAVLRKEIHARLHAPYQRALRLRARRAIDTLTEHMSQRRLELLLGLSQGYLSRLRAGACNPSPELVSNLALLAIDPKRRLVELERYWGEPIVGVEKPQHPRATRLRSAGATPGEPDAAPEPDEDDFRLL